MPKRYLGMNVFQAAQERIAWTFNNFARVYVSFSGGKDSTVMLHLTMEEAIRRQRRVGVLFIDLEGQYRLTINHIQHCYDLYSAYVEPFWVALPIHLRNAVSMYQHHWVCWEPGQEDIWVRQPPPSAIIDPAQFPFYRYAMEFEEFVPEFGKWYGGDQLTACLVGIRTGESLNRWRTIAGHGVKWDFDGQRRNWTNYISGSLWNVYPIYDWVETDLWAYHGKTGKSYNQLYNLMHKAGLTLHQMRICQPYGDDQRKGLWLFHLIEPQTWARIVARVNGANSGALYAQESGNILGNLRISKPESHSWQSFSMLLLESLPPRTREHFKDKVAVFLHWWSQRGYPGGIPDEEDRKREAAREVPSWRRIAKALLRNDYWCKGLSFSQHKSQAYERYRRIMARRRTRWGIFP